MIGAEVESVLAKIDDCDFDGAVSEMYRLSKQFSESGNLEFSDFLAYFASVSYKSDDLNQNTRPYSDIKARLDIVEGEHEELVRKVDAIAVEVFEYFKEIESIAVGERLARPALLGFNPKAKDNFIHIEGFFEGRSDHLNFENFDEIFLNQMEFYKRLKPSGVYTVASLAGRITNVVPGRFWRFMELRNEAGKVKDLLGQVSRIKDEIKRLDTEAQELRGHFWINEKSSEGFREYFLNSLLEFKNTGRMQP